MAVVTAFETGLSNFHRAVEDCREEVYPEAEVSLSRDVADRREFAAHSAS